MRLVCYSLYLSSPDARPDLLRQLLTSVETLRRYNRRVPIVLFVHEHEPPGVREALTASGVSVVQRGGYRDRLARLHPRGGGLLARYPVLHKLLNFSAITALRPWQVLLLDCDTVFFHDVERLFAQYARADCYAREEPTCARSHYGYDAAYIDEHGLARVAAQAGVRSAPPFNVGVMLLNNGVWEGLAQLERELVAVAWRLLVWLAATPADAQRSLYGEVDAVTALREAYRREGVPPREWQEALPYPSANEWILDQVTLWLTVGRIHGFSYGDFSAADVLQNGEFSEGRLNPREGVLCHYFTQNMAAVEQWLRQPATAISR